MKTFYPHKRIRTLFVMILAAQVAIGPVSRAEPPSPASAAAPAAYRAFTPANSIEQAKITIEAAERRFLPDFNTPNADQDFAVLIQVNSLAGLVDDSQGYFTYFQKNRAQLIKDAQTPGQPALNWQLFLAQTFIKYKIEKTNATVNPQSFVKWIESVTQNPWVEWTSWKTWAAIVGTYIFLKGVTYGAVVAGPAAGAVNAVLNPVVTPINQKLTIIGNKYIGPVGMRLNSWFFDGQAKEVKELESAREAVNEVRAMVEGRHYQMTNQQWSGNRKMLFKVWNRLNYLFSLLPDAYKGGRDRQVDLIIMRPRDFAQAVTNSMNASEVQRQGAESVFDRLIVKGANPQAVELAGQNLYQVMQELVQVERESPERAVEFQPALDSARSQVSALGGTPEQVERVTENFRNSLVFKRQAAAILAAQMMNDAMFSDTIEGARKLFQELIKNTSLNHMHGMLKAEVVEILERLEFNIEVKRAALTSELEKGARPAGALDKVIELNRAREGSRALAEPGSMTQEGQEKTAKERALEAAGRAGRR